MIGQLVVPAVAGPVFGELADLGIGQGGVGAMAQEMVDHLPATIDCGIVQGGAGKVETRGNEVDGAAPIEEELDRLVAAPGGRVDEGVVDDLHRDRAGRPQGSPCD